MKVLLVTPAIESPHRSEGLCLNSHYPIGLASIEAVLQKAGHDTRLLFLNDYSYDQCVFLFTHHMVTFNPDAVLIQMFSFNRVMGYELIRFLYHTYPKVKIVLGGIHATIMAEQIIKEFPFITILKGEGELLISDSLMYPAGIHEGIAVENLDNLPRINHALFKNPERNTYCILTSRGCPCACSFCVLDSISKRIVRYRSVESVLDEMEYLYKELNAKRIWIEDDNFTLDIPRAIQICEGIIKRGIKVHFICSARVKPINAELIRAMELAGFKLILFGMESGSPEMLESMHKGITQEDITKTVTLLKDSPIETVFFLMVGLPGESVRTIRETARFVMGLQKIRHIPYGDIGVAMVYPSTEVYNIAKSKGIISDDFWMTEKPVPYYTGDHSVETLMEMKHALLTMIKNQ